ncbi:MAG: methyltransferase domain-containing protein [Sporolactobacillus sp.]
MGREFIEGFEKWAEDYDQTVAGQSREYKEVFEHYPEILEQVASQARGVVLEFGPGTGNLTAKLIEKGLTVYGIEPSVNMRKKAREKIPGIQLSDGDFLDFPQPKQPIDTIVSSFAFHHLTDQEKRQALSIYFPLLSKHGRIVFADTLFDNAFEKQKIQKWARKQGYSHLLHDLQTEYYSLRTDLYQAFRNYHFVPYFKQLNRFVWLIVADKEA